MALPPGANPMLANAYGNYPALDNPIAAAQAKQAQATSGTATDTAMLRGTVADILGLQSKASIDNANAGASDIQATGYQAESGAYQNVADIAANNATVAGVAGGIKLLQENRALRTTMGSQRADVAAAGFGNSGSSLDLMRSSIQQGALTRQFTNIQTAQTQGGYLEEGAAAGAEVAGANMASSAASALAKQQRASGELATANAANETAALGQYMQTTNPTGAPLTPESTLAVSTLGIPGFGVAPGSSSGQPATFSPSLVSSITLGSPVSTGGIRGGGMGTPTGNAI